MLNNQELAPNVAEAAAQCEQTMAQSTADVVARQEVSHTFIVENGAAVVAGHARVGEPGVEQGQ